MHALAHRSWAQSLSNSYSRSVYIEPDKPIRSGLKPKLNKNAPYKHLNQIRLKWPKPKEISAGCGVEG